MMAVFCLKRQWFYAPIVSWTAASTVRGYTGLCDIGSCFDTCCRCRQSLWWKMWWYLPLALSPFLCGNDTILDAWSPSSTIWYHSLEICWVDDAACLQFSLVGILVAYHGPARWSHSSGELTIQIDILWDVTIFPILLTCPSQLRRLWVRMVNMLNMPVWDKMLAFVIWSCQVMPKSLVRLHMWKAFNLRS